MKRLISHIRAMIAQRQWGRLLAWAGIVVWGIALAGNFFSTQPWTNLYVDNQYTYFIQGLRLSGRHPYLEADWFAQTKPLHIAFTYLVAGLERMGILQQGMIAFDIFFRLVFLLSIWLLTWALWGFIGPESLKENPLRRSAFTLSVLTFLVLSLWPVFQMSAFFESIGISSAALAWEKFGFYYSFGGFASFRYYTEPVSFTVLILTALAVLPYRRWRLAAVLLGVAALFHASFLLHTGVITAFLVLFLLVNGEKRTAFQIGGLYTLFVLPLVIYLLTQMTDPFTAEANRILALYRVPHSTLPSKWWTASGWPHVIVVAVALGVLAWKGQGVLRWLPAIIGGYIALGAVYVALSGNLNVAILMPWRASGYLYTLSQLTVLTAGVCLVVKVLDRLHQNAGNFFVILPLVFLCLGVYSFGMFSILETKYADITTDEEYPFYLQIREETEPDALVITPRGETAFRLAAQRPQYVDWKSHPYKGEDVLEWWDRIGFVDAFYAPETTAAERKQLCRSVGADYYILKTQPAAIEQVVVSYRQWSLVPCP